MKNDSSPIKPMNRKRDTIVGDINLTKSILKMTEDNQKKEISTIINQYRSQKLNSSKTDKFNFTKSHLKKNEISKNTLSPVYKGNTPMKVRSPEGKLILPNLQNNSNQKRVVKNLTQAVSVDFSSLKMSSSDISSRINSPQYGTPVKSDLLRTKLKSIKDNGNTTNQAFKPRKKTDSISMSQELRVASTDSKYKKNKILTEENIKAEEDNITKLNKKIISSVAFKTQAGTNDYGFTKINQDSYIICENLLNNENYNIFGVLDGHGVNGHFVSSHITNHFSNFFSNNDNYKYKNNVLTNYKIHERLKDHNYELIKNCFIDAENQLSRTKYDVNFSGSTAVIVFQIENKLICANTGDSRAIMVFDNNKSIHKDKTEALALSRDHKPETNGEKQRIISSGGRVDKFSENGIKSGPYRVWLKNENYPGLAMSRSIGDLVASAIGVTAEPEIMEFNITNECKYIVIASDGVWEFLNNNQVMDIVNPYYKINDAKGACNKLTQISTNWWEKEDTVIDDITVLVIFFNI